MSFFRDAASHLVTSAVVMPVALLTSVVLARLLAPEQLGIYSVVFNVATVSVLLTQVGWPSAAVYRIRHASVPPAVVMAVGTTGLLALAGLAVTLLLALQAPIAGRMLGGIPTSAFQLGLILIPSQLCARFFVSVARATDCFVYANWYRLASGVGILAAIAAMLTFGEPVAESAVGAMVLADSAATLGLGLALVRATGWSWRSGNRSELQETLRYGMKTHFQSVASQIHEQIDIFMLAALLNAPAQVAFYAIAVGVANRLKFVPDGVATTLFPHVTGAGSERAADLAARAARHAALWVWVSVLALFVVAPTALPLIWGAEFEASVAPLLVLLPGVALLTTYMVLARYFMAINRQHTNTSIQLVSILANVLLNWFLIPRLGILGAAAASLISYSIAAVLMILAFRRSSGCKARDVLLVRRQDLAEYAGRLRQLRVRRRR